VSEILKGLEMAAKAIADAAAEIEALRARLIADPTIDGSASDKIAEEIAADLPESSER